MFSGSPTDPFQNSRQAGALLSRERHMGQVRQLPCGSGGSRERTGGQEPACSALLLCVEI